MKRATLLPIAAAVIVVGVALILLPRPTPAARTPTTPDLGVSLDVVADWSTAGAFVDATAMLRKWGKPGAGWEENPDLKLTADNHPLADADAVTFLRGYPAGVYTLRYEGTATIAFTGFAAVVPGSLHKTGTLTTAQVQVKPHKADDLLSLQVRGVDAKDPLRNLQLLTPGHVDAKQVFNEAFLRRVRPFSSIRFMDWQQINNSTCREWADRAKVTAIGRTGPAGVPLEEIVALVNATKRNAWVNIPHAASDDYVKQFAALLRDRLHPAAILRFEYSNEVWNQSFQQARDNIAAAKANSTLTASDDFGRSAQQAAEKLAHFAGIFRAIFGDRAYAARVRPVVGGFAAGDYWSETQLKWLAERHRGLAVELAIAPYFGHQEDIDDLDKPGTSADAIFDRLAARMDEKLAKWIERHAAMSSKYGVPLIAYEGGVHLTATNGVNEDLKRHMQDDPRMGRLYRHLFDLWSKNGGGLFTHYAHVGPYTRFGYWGLLESIDQPGSVKWDTCMSLRMAPGDANLDGKVDAADLAIVKANFGQSGKWWEQGDFNADGVVDAEDVKLLKASFKNPPPQAQTDMGALLQRKLPKP